MPTNSAARVARHRAEAKKKGQVRREYTATPAEHVELRATLDRLREQVKA